jgi:4'-phosphopantetheinyl transferase EntD
LSLLEQTIDGGIQITYLPRDLEVCDMQLHSGLSDANRARLTDLQHPLRRDEFLRARYLVRATLGCNVDPEQDGDGIIVWPSGKQGSVSHSSGHVGLAFADAGIYASVGFDLEHIARVKAILREKICTPSELVLIDSGQIRLADVFCAKEALFKSHYPLGRKRFWFLDAEIVRVDNSRVVTPVRQHIEMAVLTDTGPTTPAGTITRVMLLNTHFDGCVAAIATLSSFDHRTNACLKRF